MPISIRQHETSKALMLYYCDGLEVVKYLLGNPLFIKLMSYCPVQIYKDASWSECIYSDYMTANHAWDFQVCSLCFVSYLLTTYTIMKSTLPPGATQVGIVVGSDKTHLTTTSGGLELHPVYLTIVNINSEVHAKVSSHAWLCVAYIPIPKFKPKVPKDVHSILSACLWHYCIDICMASLKKAAYSGAMAADAAGELRHIFTPLVAWIADNPEQYLIAGVVKAVSPISMASLSEFGDAYPHPPRSGKSTLDALAWLEEEIDPWEVSRFAAVARNYGLLGVHRPFWRDWHVADPATFLTPKILHACHKFFFDHLLRWCKQIVGATKLDERFKALHRCVGYRHFGEGVTALKQISGRDHRNLQRTIIAIIAGITPHSFVSSIHALVDFIYQVQAPTFTDTSIRSFVNTLQEFHNLKAIVLETGARSGKQGPMTHFNIPKLELLQHFGCSVAALGSPMQWTADITEHLHVINCKQPFRATNHRNFEEQCVRVLDCLERILNFDVYHLVRTHGLNTVSTIIRDADRVSDQAVPVKERFHDAPRPLRNLFLKGIVAPNAQVTFSLTKIPDISGLSLTDTAAMYHLPDLVPALGDYISGLSYQQRGGCCISQHSTPVGHEHINVWFKFKIQACSFHQNNVIMKPETVEVHRPSLEHPLGKCDAVLIDSTDGQESAFECEFDYTCICRLILSLRLLLLRQWSKLPKFGLYLS